MGIDTPLTTAGLHWLGSEVKEATLWDGIHLDEVVTKGSYLVEISEVIKTGHLGA